MSIPEQNEELAIFSETVSKFLESDIAPHYEQWEKDKIVPRSFWQVMGENGFLCCDVPEEYGGFGVDFRFNMVVAELMAKAGFMALACNIVVHADICAHYLLNMGSEAQKQKYLPSMVSGECIGAICMTEPGAGSDLQGMKSNAVKKGDKWILNGSKTFITNGQNAGLYVVAARTNFDVKAAKGITLFLVDEDKAGFSRGQNLDKMGLAAADTSELFFSDVELTDDDVLGKVDEGFFVLMDELPRERLSLACVATAHAEGAMQLAIDYVKERKAFGAPLSAIQDIRFKLADMYCETETYRVLVEHYKSLLINKQLTAEQASMAKMVTTEMEDSLIDRALQMFGGYGYMREYPISRFYVDSRVQRIYGGTTEIMKEVISRKVLA